LFNNHLVNVQYVNPSLFLCVVPELDLAAGKEVMVSIAYQGKPLHATAVQFSVNNPDWYEEMNAVPPYCSFIRLLYLRCEWSSKRIWEKIFYVLASPIILLRYLTIPWVADTTPETSYNRLEFSIYPITCSMFMLNIFGYDSILKAIAGVVPLWGLVLCIGFFVSCVMFLTLDFQITSKFSMRDIYNKFYYIVAFVMSVVWIFILADELVSLLRTLGLILGISQSILGLLFFGVSNSVGDLISDTVVARVSPEMSISACYGSPLLNIGIGLSVPVIWNFITKSQAFIAFDMDLKIAVAFGVVFFVLLVTMVWISSARFTMTPVFALFLMAIYVIFLSFCVSVEFWWKIDFIINN